jgi:D-alanyl-D-alanine-carboxypeptidase/D-alanyl-D-alanine-endopeptidase
VRNWDIATFEGAGGLRSTANDLLNFPAAELRTLDMALKPAMARQLSLRRPTGIPTLPVARGWDIISDASGNVMWHNGATGGYRTLFGFAPAISARVVVLSNVLTATGIDDIGFHVLTGKPLATAAPTPAALRKEAPLNTAVLQRDVGRYQLTPNVDIAMTFESNHLLAQLTGQGEIPNLSCK